MAEQRVRSILDAQGQDFAGPGYWETEGSIVLELGDGSIRVLRIGPPDTDGNRFARVSGEAVNHTAILDAAFSFFLTEWTVKQLWAFL